MHEFAEQLRDYLAELSDLRQRGAAEHAVCDAFLRFLRAAFPRLGQSEPILLEKHIPAQRVRGGFADALYGQGKRIPDRLNYSLALDFVKGRPLRFSRTELGHGGEL